MRGELIGVYGGMVHDLAAWDFFGTMTPRDRTPAMWTVLPPQVQSRRCARLKASRKRELRYVGPGFLLRVWDEVTGRIEHLTGGRMEWVWVPEPHAGRAGLMLHAHFVAMLRGERDPMVREAIRAIMKCELDERCGFSRVERYEDKSGAHYMAEYLVKGGTLHLSSGLRDAGGLKLPTFG